jgi:hypothetical protein
MSTPATALVDSRLGPGTLTIATIERSYQIANVRLEPDISENDGTPTLAVPAPPPEAVIGWKLSGSAIQDWEQGADSFVNYLMDNALDEVAFDWVPETATTGLKYSGTVQLRPVTIGGDAGVQITSDFELPLVGAPTRTDPALGTTGRSSRKAE